MARGHLSEIELTEYADGETLREAVGAVEDHLRQCDLCAASLAGTRRAVAAVGRLQLVGAPPDLGLRVAAKLAREPRPTLTCRRALPLLHAQLDRCLSPLLLAPLEKHLKSCASCREQSVSLARASHLVQALSPVTSPAEVRERVLEGARVMAAPRLAPWGLRLRPALATAGVLVLAALGLVLRPGHQPGAPKPAGNIAARPTSGSAESPALPRESAAPPMVALAEPGLVEPEQVGPTGASGRPPLRMARHASAQVEAARTPRAVRARAERPLSPRSANVIAASPAALRTLRMVAQSASFDREPQRAMDLAAESFATLTSEEMLDRLPEAAASGAGAGPFVAPAPMPGPATEPPAGTRGAGLDSASAPGAAAFVVEPDSLA